MLNLYAEKFESDENNFDTIVVKSISLCDLSFALYKSQCMENMIYLPRTMCQWIYDICYRCWNSSYKVGKFFL